MTSSTASISIHNKTKKLKNNGVKNGATIGLCLLLLCVSINETDVLLYNVYLQQASDEAGLKLRVHNHGCSAMPWSCCRPASASTDIWAYPKKNSLDSMGSNASQISYQTDQNRYYT